MVVDRRGQEVELQVRMLDAGLGADEAAGLQVRGGADALAGQEPLHAAHRHAVRLGISVERDRLGAVLLDIHLQVLLEILPDAGQVVLHRDAGLLQMVRRADTRQHEQLRRVDGAAGQDYFTFSAIAQDAAVLRELDADGALALEQHAEREGAGLYVHVGALLGRAQERSRG
jgi:hypothetical protein